jgi:hypothetical protein
LEFLSLNADKGVTQISHVASQDHDMYTGVVLTIVALHGAAFLILLGHWLVAAGLFPEATNAFQEQYRHRPMRAVLVGIFSYGPLFLLLLNSGKIPNGLVRAMVVIAGFLALLIALAGTAGLALQVGRNLTGDSTPWQQGLRGGVVLALVFITPALGSLFLLHVGLASGFGAFLLARPWKSREVAAVSINASAVATS